MLDDPSSMKLDHFSHLRRQWTAKAQSFHVGLTTLDEDDESTIDVTRVVILFKDLLQGYETTRTTPSVKKMPRSEGKGGSNRKGGEKPSQEYYDDMLEPPPYPPPPVPELAVDDSQVK